MAVENELLQALEMISQGREEGFNILYSRTYNYVYSRAKFIMKDEEDALDLTQETFIQAYRGIHSLEDANNVYAWLGGIVYRQGMKIFRKKRELLVSDDGEHIFEEVVSQDMSSNPEDAAQQKVTSEIVMSMIEELPELQKSAVLAFYYDNMKIDDIAKVCECSSNTIKSRLNYAKKYLKEKVEAHEKANRYKLCSLSPAVLLLACKSLFATEKYTLAKSTAQNIYAASCNVLGLNTGTLTLAGAGGATVSSAGASTAVTAGITGAGGTATTGAGALATKAGLTLGAKIAIAVVALGTAGAIAAGALFLSNTGEEKKPDRIEETQDALAADKQISDATSPEVGTSSEDNPTEPDISFVDYVMDWKDANLEAAMREVLDIYDRDIMYSDVKDLTYLELNDKEITDISALECLTGLEHLELAENDISDINALANLSNLEFLDLGENYAVSDISALETLTDLYYLDISGNKISDISPLANLTGLRTLTMEYNSIQDISPLANLTELSFLYIYNNQVADISALQNLTLIDTLVLSHNPISDISVLENLINLEWLNMRNCEISDISALANLTNMTYMVLDFNNISDISPLAGLTNLESLSISDNQITDLSPLTNLTKLKKLDIEDNNITDYSPVSFVPELYY